MSKAQKPRKVKDHFRISFFLEYLQSKNFTSTTQYSYEKAVQRFTAWLDHQKLEVEQVGYNDITAYIKHLKAHCNRHSIAQNINPIKLYFKALIKENIVTGNPAAHINLQSKRQEQLHHILKPEELDYIYQNYKGDQRAKVVLGLLIYQGITTGELKRIEVDHINFIKGTIHIIESKKTNGRRLELKPHQAITLHSYLQEERQTLLSICKDASIIERLIITERSNGIGYVLVKLLKELRKEYQELQSFNQVRASVITYWLKQYNLRQTQVMAGHRYVSSTEKYHINDIETLENNLKQFRPIITNPLD